jgi:hypothetical protein
VEVESVILTLYKAAVLSLAKGVPTTGAVFSSNRVESRKDAAYCNLAELINF